MAAPELQNTMSQQVSKEVSIIEGRLIWGAYYGGLYIVVGFEGDYYFASHVSV